MVITTSQSLKWRLKFASVVQLTVQTQRLVITAINDQEKLQTLTSKKLEAA